jgi:hypothetical protein
MLAGSVAEPDRSAAARYETLIRQANSIRALKEPQELFQVLVDEFRNGVLFDAIALFDGSANRMHWHFGPSCQQEEGSSEVESSGPDARNR